MIILGLTGNIGSGKTTFAKFLVDIEAKSRHFESWQIIAEVANQLRKSHSQHPAPSDIAAINDWLSVLPEIVTKVCHKQVEPQQIIITADRLRQAPDSYAKLLEYLELMVDQPTLQTGSINEASKETFRSLLQWLGGYLVKTVGSGIWYDELISRLKLTPEIELATFGGVRFPGDARRIVEAGGQIIRVERPSIAAKDANEVTERERGLIVPDTVVVNNAGLTELQNCAVKLWKDLKHNRLAKRYLADRIQA